MTILFPGQGLSGPPGPSGPSGTSRIKAGGRVASDGTLGASFGTTSCVNTSDGVYVITLNVGFTHNNWIVLAMSDHGYTEKIMTAEVNDPGFNKATINCVDGSNANSETYFTYVVIDLS